MLYGKMPQRNFNNEIEFPSQVPVSKAAKDFIRKSLNLDPTERPNIDELS